MRRDSQFYLFGFLTVATASAFCVPIVWRQISGKEDYDPSALVFILVLIVGVNAGLLIALIKAKRREAAARLEVRAPVGNPGTSEAFMTLDFTHTFPHIIWVSSVSYDSEAPDGFRYKMFATRLEPEM